jgi:hypothetical protein
LLKLCAACDTLIIDEKTAYDLNNINDNMTLGILGVIYQAESQRTGSRSKATRRTKAETGELRLRLPTGYVYDGDDNLVFDKTENDQGSMSVQETISFFFSKFDELRSAFKVVKHFSRRGILFPTRRGCGKKSTIVWGELNDTRAVDILHNPVYAGTYVYDKTISTDKMLAPDSSEQKKKRVKVSLDSDEVVLRHGAHEGYITWAKFTENQKILEDNCYGPKGKFKGPGAVREGSALLQGLVVCGVCGWRLSMHYDGRDGSARYDCVNKARWLGKSDCLTITARRLDEVVVDAFLKAVSPAQMQLTLRELEEVGKEAQSDDCHGTEELENAKAECEQARRRFEAIDPQNALVFREYEKSLQEKMVDVERLEKKYAKASKIPRQKLTKEELESLLELPETLSTSWESDVVTNAERKQFLRCLIRKVIVKKREDSEYHDVIISWITGAAMALTVIKDGRFLHPGAVGLMRRLAPDHTVSQIIYELHEAGFKPQGGRQWFSRSAVSQAFKAYGIKLACPERPMGDNSPRGDGRYSTTAVAKMLNVCADTVYVWCVNGTLDAVRKRPRCAYWIKISPEEVVALKRAISDKATARNVGKSLDG